MNKEVKKVIIAAILFIVALVIPFNNIWINRSIFIISFIIVGFETVINAFKNIIKGELLDECFLMSIATIGAFLIGEYPEAVTVMLLYEIGELFQDYAVDKSRDSISSLMDIRPDYANVIRENETKKVDSNEVKIGEIIIVKPGEKIPLDGKVIEGESMIDVSALTGESVPIKVKNGDTILSGSINVHGLLKIEVTKEFGESTVSKILDLVENASHKKAKSENFITKFAKYYTPIVVILAVLLAIVPPLIIKETTFIEWINRALSFLVVSCPCALVISIPLSFFGGIGGAAKSNILIKGSNYIESLSKTKIVVMDKTGTLTQGVFEVQKIEPKDLSKEELLYLAAHAESFSNHPIASSVKKAYGNEINNNIVNDTKEISGQGINAKVDGKDILIGNQKLMNENNIEFKTSDEIGTILYIAVDKKYVGYILIADSIKQDSKLAINNLKQDGINRIIMLTGDKKEVSESVASELEINEVYSELLPNGKVQKVEEFLKQKSKDEVLAFAGDGINDAPVLALSDIGIAMGGVGSDSAIEAADIVIMNDEPSKIGKAIKISKKTMRIVKENIIFAIGVKVLVLILSAFGISTLWEAVFADVGVSIIAVFNALRALNTKNI